MKIIVTHASSFDYEKEFYAPLKKAVEGTDHELIFPHVWHAQNKSTKEFLKNADLVIGEVSYPSTGQGIEFGWADMLNVPILFVRKQGAKSSSALKYLKGDYIEYADGNDMTDKIRTFLVSKS
ncbi:MAG: hypothetical protein UY50_C0021G0018 [Parcubacteria group bacterium GW2011_GWA2_49_9]|nr:MAG: hypothetical protein UY50_C0021G0018 [Parcubacteria group bacterium GW2011_GWA2_49_9]